MRKMMKAVLVLITILTVTYVGVVVYANTSSSHSADSDGYGKEPIDYGILKTYFAEKLETEPQEWNTTEELGITFGRRMRATYKTSETYLILIVDEEKALPWMNGTIPEPLCGDCRESGSCWVVKYGDSFYHIVSLWVTPGLPERVKQWQIPIGGVLGVGWVLTGVLSLKGRKP